MALRDSRQLSNISRACWWCREVLTCVAPLPVPRLRCAGAGKTAIAEAAAAAVLARGQRVIYTTPLKALSNQKLFETRAKFGTARWGGAWILGGEGHGGLGGRVGRTLHLGRACCGLAPHGGMIA